MTVVICNEEYSNIVNNIVNIEDSLGVFQKFPLKGVSILLSSKKGGIDRFN